MRGRPVRYVDPDGRELVGAIIGGVSGIVGGVSGVLVHGGTWGQAVTAGVVGGVVGAGVGLIDPTGMVVGRLGIVAGTLAGAAIGASSGALGDLHRPRNQPDSPSAGLSLQRALRCHVRTLRRDWRRFSGAIGGAAPYREPAAPDQGSSAVR